MTPKAQDERLPELLVAQMCNEILLQRAVNAALLEALERVSASFASLPPLIPVECREALDAARAAIAQAKGKP